MALLQWLIGLKACLGNQTTRKPSGRTIFDLPLDVVSLITDELELHDLFLLSHVNRCARRLAQRCWATTFALLSKDQKLDFLTGLAYTLPDRWVCEDCCKLHSKDDIDDRFDRRLMYLRSLSRCGFEQGRNLNCMYNINHSHIQLALKLQTRKPPQHKTAIRIHWGPFSDGLLERLMTPYDGSVYRGQSHYAAPKIVEGRFLLHLHRAFVTTETDFMDDMKFARICPHMQLVMHIMGASIRVVPPFRDYGPSDFEDCVILASHRPGEGVTGSCGRCPTDFSVMFDGSAMHIELWHDFGSYASPANLNWKVHVLSAENTGSKGPVVYHRPGSVRELYARE